MPAKTHFLSTLQLIRLALLTSIALISSACSPVHVLNSLVPDSGYQLQSNISYGPHERQKLDIYTPKTPSNQPKKIVIFFYGGSWDSGEKADYKFVGEALSSQGFIVVIPNYRVYPDVLFPAFMEDPASVAKWVKTNIQQYQPLPNNLTASTNSSTLASRDNVDKVFLTGHSAGAHLAVMLAVNPEYLAQVSLKPTDFSGVVGLAGPYDFLPLRAARLKVIFGAEAERWKSQPISFVDGKNPPMLLAVGRKDSIVAPYNTDHMVKAIKSKNGAVDIAEFAQYGHIDMVAKLARPIRGDGALLKKMVEFLNQH